MRAAGNNAKSDTKTLHFLLEIGERGRAERSATASGLEKQVQQMKINSELSMTPIESIPTTQWSKFPR